MCDIIDTQDQAWPVFQQELLLLLVCCSQVVTSTHYLMVEVVDTSQHLPYLNLFIKVKLFMIPFSCQMWHHVNFQSVTNMHITVIIYVEAYIHEIKMD